MKRIVWLLFLCALVTAAAVLLWPRAPELTATLSQHRGRTFEQVRTALGPPLRTESFGLSQALDEMRAGLPSKVYIAASRPGDQSIVIKEAVWRDGDYYLTIWFQDVDGTWIAIDGVRWHKDVLF